MSSAYAQIGDRLLIQETNLELDTITTHFGSIAPVELFVLLYEGLQLG